MTPPLMAKIGQTCNWNAARKGAGFAWCLLGLSLMLAVTLLPGCGGGSTTTAGVGSGGTGLAGGTVSGFGSVMVDGIEYQDDNAQRSGEIKLGQQVRVRYSGSNVADSIEVLPQLIGPVTAGLDAHGWMQVMGQWVRVVKTGDPVTRSNATVLGGYATAAVIAPGDDVEAHGSWVMDASKSAYVLMATRIEKRATVADPVQLGGVVQALAGNLFRLNRAGGSQIQAATLPQGLADGEWVQMLLPRSALGRAPLQASQVLRASLTVQDVQGRAVRVSGLASAYDAASRSVQVQGMRVTLDAGAGVDSAALAQGAFVSLLLDPASSAASGLRASSAIVRGPATAPNNADLGATHELKGNASGIDWNAPVLNFSLRGVSVQAPASALDTSCVGRRAGVATYVQVVGQLQVAGETVTASRVSCGNP